MIALSAALGLSGMGFKTGEAVTASECEATTDLSVAANLDADELGAGDLKGKIVNSSDDNDYDEVMIRLDFYGSDGSQIGTDEIDVDESATMQRENDLDVDVDIDDGDIDADADLETESDLDATVETDDGLMGSDDMNDSRSALSTDGTVLHSQVVTISEDVQAGEVEEFEVDVTPPAGTTRVVASVVCAD